MNDDQKIQQLEILQKIFRYFFKGEFPQDSGQIVMPSSMEWTEQGFKDYVFQITGTQTITEARNILFDPIKGLKILPVYLNSASYSEKEAIGKLNDIRPTDQPAATTLDTSDLERKAKLSQEQLKKSQQTAAYKQRTFRERAERVALQQKERVQQQATKQSSKPAPPSSFTIPPRPGSTVKENTTVSTSNNIEGKTTFIVSPEDKDVISKQKLRDQAREVYGEQVYLEPVKPIQPVVLRRQAIALLTTIAVNEQKDSLKTVQDLADHISQSKNIPESIRALYAPEQIKSFAPIIAHDIISKNNLLWSEMARVGVDPTKITDSLIITPKTSLVSVLRAMAELYPSTDIPETTLAASISEDTFQAFATSILGPDTATVLYGEKSEMKRVNEPSERSIRINLDKLVDFSKDAKSLFNKNKNLLSEGQNPLSNILKQFESVKIETPTNSDFFNFLQSLKDLFSVGNATTATAVGAASGVGIGTFSAYQFYSPTLFTAWRAQAVLAGKMTAFDMPAYQALISSLSPAEQSLRLASLGQFTSPAGSLFLPTEIASISAPTTLASATASSTGVIVTEAGVVGTSVVASAEAGAAVGATTGSVVPIIGTAIGAVVGIVTGWIVSKINWHKIKTFFKENILIGPALILVGLGTMFGGGVVVGGIIGLAGAGFTGMSGVTSFGAGIGTVVGGIGSIFGIALKTTFKETWKPVLTITTVIPFFVALVLFIINSSAYVIPTGSSITGSAPIVDFPDLPTDTCFKFDDTWNNAPANTRSYVFNAVSVLSQQFPELVSKVCYKPPTVKREIVLSYNPTGVWYCAVANGANGTIKFTDLDGGCMKVPQPGRMDFTLYLVSHEMGHIVDANWPVMAGFLFTTQGEGPLPTYPQGPAFGLPVEDMPESIGVYSYCKLVGGYCNHYNNYPKHMQFVETYIGKVN